MRWRSRNPNLPVQEGNTGEIVDGFLELHHWWFTTKTNSLFGQRGCVRKLLIDNIENGVEPGPRDRYGFHYVLAKFHQEYLREYKKVVMAEEIPSKEETGSQTQGTTDSKNTN